MVSSVVPTEFLMKVSEKLMRLIAASSASSSSRCLPEPGREALEIKKDHRSGVKREQLAD